MTKAEGLLAEIMKRTEEEGLLHHYPQRFKDWWYDFKTADEKVIIFEG